MPRSARTCPLPVGRHAAFQVLQQLLEVMDARILWHGPQSRVQATGMAQPRTSTLLESTVQRSRYQYWHPGPEAAVAPHLPSTARSRATRGRNTSSLPAHGADPHMCGWQQDYHSRSRWNTVPSCCSNTCATRRTDLTDAEALGES